MSGMYRFWGMLRIMVIVVKKLEKDVVEDDVWVTWDYEHVEKDEFDGGVETT